MRIQDKIFITIIGCICLVLIVASIVNFVYYSGERAGRYADSDEIVEHSGEVYISKELAEKEGFFITDFTMNQNTVIQDTEFSVYTITFWDDEDKMIGVLSWDTGIFVFRGRAKESAHMFFDHFLKLMVDNYIDQQLSEFVDQKLEEGRKKEGYGKNSLLNEEWWKKKEKK